MVLVFVNHIDTFAGRVIGQVSCVLVYCIRVTVHPTQVLSSSIAGATSTELPDDDDDDLQQDGAQASNDPAAKLPYEVVGTVEDPSSTKPDWAKAIAKVRFYITETSTSCTQNDRQLA